MNRIFDNPQQKGLSNISEQNQSQLTLDAFNKWYATLPKWTEEEAQREAQNQLNMDIENNTFYNPHI